MTDLFLRITNNDITEDIPVTGVGGVLRVAVGAFGARSSIWRIWANTRTSDVYVAARTVAGVQKYSFHQSGDWRYAWTSAATAQNFTDGKERVIDRWERPTEDSNGWTAALSILVRAEDVTRVSSGDDENETVRWLPVPSPGRAMGIYLMIVRPDVGDDVELPGLAPIEVLGLANGEALLVLAGPRDVQPETALILKEARERGLALRPDAAERVGEPGLRLAVFTLDTEGHRQVWDTAF